MVEICLQLPLLLLLCLVNLSAGNSPLDDWNTTLAQYDPSIPPRNSRGESQVEISMFLKTLQINTLDNSYTTQVYFRQSWLEPRLSHKPDESAAFQLVDWSRIWTPDTYFINELDGKLLSVTKDNVFTRVAPEGHVLMSQHLNLKLSCNMNLATFPFDTQTCSLLIGSYRHHISKVGYSWKNAHSAVVADDARPAGFKLISTTASDCNSAPSSAVDTSKPATFENDCLALHLVLQRSSMHYVLQVFIPLTLLCSIAWLTFWIRQEQVRATVLMFTFSLAVVFATMVRQSLPPFGSPTMIDYFAGAGLLFVFAAIVQFVIVRWHVEKDEKDPLTNNLDGQWRLAYPIVFGGFVLIYSLVAYFI